MEAEPKCERPEAGFHAIRATKSVPKQLKELAELRKQGIVKTSPPPRGVGTDNMHMIEARARQLTTAAPRRAPCAMPRRIFFAHAQTHLFCPHLALGSWIAACSRGHQG